MPGLIDFLKQKTNLEERELKLSFFSLIVAQLLIFLLLIYFATIGVNGKKGIDIPAMLISIYILFPLPFTFCTTIVCKTLFKKNRSSRKKKTKQKSSFFFFLMLLLIYTVFLGLIIWGQAGKNFPSADLYYAFLVIWQAPWSVLITEYFLSIICS